MYCPCDDGEPQFCLIHNPPASNAEVMRYPFGDGGVMHGPGYSRLVSNANENPPRGRKFGDIRHRLWLWLLRTFGLGDQ